MNKYEKEMISTENSFDYAKNLNFSKLLID
jgi:hypothetical protein